MAKSKQTKSYFTHDSGARNSDKLIKVRMRHGAAGYGVYFMILERLREEDDYMSVKDYNMIAFDLRVDASLIKSVVEDFGLFVFTDDGKYFHSEEFSRRMGIKDEITTRKSEAGKKGMARRYAHESEEVALKNENEIDNTVITQLQEKANSVITQLPKNGNTAITELPEIDNTVITQLGKNANNKSKVKKRKENTPPHTPPLLVGDSSDAEAETLFEGSNYQNRNAQTLAAVLKSFGATEDYAQDLMRMSNGGEPSSPIWGLLDYLRNSGGKYSVTDVVRTMAQYEKAGKLKCRSALRARLESELQETIKPEEIPEVLAALTCQIREERCQLAIEEVRRANGRIRLPGKYILSEIAKVT